MAGEVWKSLHMFIGSIKDGNSKFVGDEAELLLLDPLLVGALF